MSKKSILSLGLMLLLLPMLGACASSGGGTAGGGGTPDIAPAPVDFTQETGENGLLTPRAVFTRYIDAVGGEKALRSHSSSVSKGKMEIAAMGISGDLTIWSSAPNLFLMVADLGMGVMTTGYNGEVGYSDNPMTGPTILEGSQLSQALQQADFYGPLNWETTFPTAETVELADFKGTSAYKLRLVDASGDEQFHYYAEDTGLLVGFEQNQSSPMGDVFVTAAVSDYQEFGGVMTPTVTSLDMMGTEIKQVIESVSYEEVDASQYDLPDSIKALVQ